MKGKYLLSIDKVTKVMNNDPLFSIESLEVSMGDFITIQGTSGSGKTTLLNIIGMNDTFSTGQYLFEGIDVTKISKKEKLKIKRNKLSFLFQDFGLVEEETIDFNLEIGLKYQKMTKKQKQQAKITALKEVNLNKVLSTSISRLSGGEKQRVALARLILKPGVLILADEPTGSLDTKNREIVTKILTHQVKKGKAVIIVTHDDDLAKKGNKKLVLS